jgi:hypothetical protein
MSPSNLFYIILMCFSTILLVWLSIAKYYAIKNRKTQNIESYSMWLAAQEAAKLVHLVQKKSKPKKESKNKNSDNKQFG